MSDGGKGSSPRPYSVSKEEYNQNFDNIFRKDVKQEGAKELIDVLNQHPSSNAA
jgi:hypothetical protein